MGFDRAFQHILKQECPSAPASCKTDDPTDPGGRTAYGVTQTSYDKWRQQQNLSKQDVWNIDMHEVRAVYADKYWVGSGASKMTPDVALVYFDVVVNSGPEAAGLVLQHALRQFGAYLVVDGMAGPKTLQALADRREHDEDIAQEMLWQRLTQYKNLVRGYYKSGRLETASKWSWIWMARLGRLREALR